MAVIEWKKEEGVAVVTMCNGANRQNQEFAKQMNRCFDEILEDTSLSSVILTSSDEKNFSQGIDIEWMGLKMQDQDFETIKSFMYGMNGIFKRLLLMPIPVIAAINGHAFGNGAILACACDFRFMRVDRGFFCFPEVDVSIPFLPGMIAFVRKAIPEYQFNEMLLSGKRMTADLLAASNVIVKACDNQETLMAEAMAFAAGFTKKRGIFGELKKRIHKDLVHTMDTQDPAYIDALNLFVQE
jgi:enoyl-CoA hydratase/carnithine racemase